MVQDAPFRAFACNRRAVALEFVRDSREAGQAKEDVMAKGQMRSNKEKKKPKQDKSKKNKKGEPAPSPFAPGQGQTHTNPYGKKS